VTVKRFPPETFPPGFHPMIPGQGQDGRPPLVGVRPPPPTREAHPNLIGVGWSGPNVRELLPNGQDECVLDVRRPQTYSGGCDGLATVHIDTWDVTPSGHEAATGRIICTCRYNDGASGGEFEFDLTRSCLFSIGGTDSINISARWVSDTPDENPVVFATKRIHANVNWLGSVSPKAARAVLDPIAITVAAPSPLLRIPRQAESLLVLGTPSARLPGVTASFFRTDIGPVVVYDTLNPNANGTPIVAGVEFVQLTTLADITVIPVFELWP
jgi:hypothetical protein